MHASYDERSDVWSLGCIILEMATCGFMDVSDYHIVNKNFCKEVTPSSAHAAIRDLNHIVSTKGFTPDNRRCT